MDNNFETTNTVVPNEPKKKSNKGLIIFLILIILGLAGFITYDKVLKDKYFSKKTETKEVKKEDNKKQEIKKEGLTADELYLKYIENLKTSHSVVYNNGENISDDEATKLEKNDGVYKYGSMEYACDSYGQEGYSVCAYLEDNSLSIRYEKYEEAEGNTDPNKVVNKNKIDSNVLKYFVTTRGNNGYVEVYYIKNDGKLYVLNTDKLLQGTKEINEIKKVKNIIDVRSSSFGFFSGWEEAILEDIEGNLFRIDENFNAIKLN